MGHRCLISFIVPVYNGALWIDECICSLKLCGTDCYEIIIVDDCSNDGSPDKCRQYSVEDTRIKYFRNSENLGIAKTRQRGLDISEGEYIVFIDQDDRILPGVVYKCVKILKVSGADALYTNNYSWIQEGRERMVARTTIRQNRVLHATELSQVLKSLLLQNRYHTFSQVDPSIWNVIYNADFVKKNNLKLVQFVSYEDDLLFNIQVLSKAVQIILDCDNIYYCHRIRNGSEQLHYKYICDFHNKSIRQQKFILDVVGELINQRDKKIVTGFFQSKRILSEMEMCSNPDDRSAELKKIHINKFRQSVKYEKNNLVGIETFRYLGKGERICLILALLNPERSVFINRIIFKYYYN